MTSYRKELLHSWVQEAPSVRDLAALLDVEAPFGVRALLDRLSVVESVAVESDIHTDDETPINGHVKTTLRSDGSYVFSGFMRATGFTSYHFAVQAWVNVAEGTVIAAQKRGHVYGTDTPGDRQCNWSEPGVNRGIVLRWRALRQGRSIGFSLHANIAGVLGTARDVLLFAINSVLVSAGPAGWIVLIGNELAGLDTRLTSSNILDGVVVSGATLLIVWPFGVVLAPLADVRHRSMKNHERAFADRVFGGTIDYDRVVLTNLSHDNGRKFTIPFIGNTILVNLNDAFDDPVRYAELAGSDYPEPGAVFIHELTHAWQICNKSFVGVICGMSSNYEYFDSRGRTADTAWPRREWGTFNNEQQAHIVDDWYGAHVQRDGAGNFTIDAQGLPVTELDGFDALNDPAFPFIRDHIRPPAP